MVVKMSVGRPTKPGTYILQLRVKTGGWRNSRLADVRLLGEDLMVYCLDVDVHCWIEAVPGDARWSVEPIEIEGDTRLN